jgi:hypothetical protein
MFNQRYIRDKVVEKRLETLRLYANEANELFTSVPDYQSTTKFFVELAEANKDKLVLIESLIDKAKAESVNPEIVKGLIDLSNQLQGDIENIIQVVQNANTAI